MKNKNWTPVDAFVTEYGFRTGATFVYQPGSGEVTMKTGTGIYLEDLKELIKSIEHHELRIKIKGEIFVYALEEEMEEPKKPHKGHTPGQEAINYCPECGAPATHPSGLCRDCHQAKLETEEIPEEIIEEAERIDAEAIEEKKESSEEDVVIIE